MGMHRYPLRTCGHHSRHYRKELPAWGKKLEEEGARGKVEEGARGKSSRRSRTEKYTPFNKSEAVLLQGPKASAPAHGYERTSKSYNRRFPLNYRRPTRETTSKLTK